MFEPFLIASRSCLGETLAQAEMKMVLAKNVKNSDLEFARDQFESESGAKWTDQKASLAHERKPLLIKIKPRTREQ